MASVNNFARDIGTGSSEPLKLEGKREARGCPSFAETTPDWYQAPILESLSLTQKERLDKLLPKVSLLTPWLYSQKVRNKFRSLEKEYPLDKKKVISFNFSKWHRKIKSKIPTILVSGDGAAHVLAGLPFSKVKISYLVRTSQECSRIKNALADFVIKHLGFKVQKKDRAVFRKFVLAIYLQRESGSKIFHLPPNISFELSTLESYSTLSPELGFHVSLEEPHPAYSMHETTCQSLHARTFTLDMSKKDPFTILEVVDKVTLGTWYVDPPCLEEAVRRLPENPAEFKKTFKEFLARTYFRDPQGQKIATLNILKIIHQSHIHKQLKVEYTKSIAKSMGLQQPLFLWDFLARAPSKCPEVLDLLAGCGLLAARKEGRDYYPRFNGHVLNHIILGKHCLSIPSHPDLINRKFFAAWQEIERDYKCEEHFNPHEDLLADLGFHVPLSLIGRPTIRIDKGFEGQRPEEFAEAEAIFFKVMENRLKDDQLCERTAYKRLDIWLANDGSEHPAKEVIERLMHARKAENYALLKNLLERVNYLVQGHVEGLSSILPFLIPFWYGLLLKKELGNPGPLMRFLVLVSGSYEQFNTEQKKQHKKITETLLQNNSFAQDQTTTIDEEIITFDWLFALIKLPEHNKHALELFERRIRWLTRKAGQPEVTHLLQIGIDKWEQNRHHFITASFCDIITLELIQQFISFPQGRVIGYEFLERESKNISSDKIENMAQHVVKNMILYDPQPEKAISEFLTRFNLLRPIRTALGIPNPHALLLAILGMPVPAIIQQLEQEIPHVCKEARFFQVEQLMKGKDEKKAFQAWTQIDIEKYTHNQGFRLTSQCLQLLIKKDASDKDRKTVWVALLSQIEKHKEKIELPEIIPLLLTLLESKEHEKAVKLFDLVSEIYSDLKKSAEVLLKLTDSYLEKGKEPPVMIMEAYVQCKADVQELINLLDRHLNTNLDNALAFALTLSQFIPFSFLTFETCLVRYIRFERKSEFMTRCMIKLFIGLAEKGLIDHTTSVEYESLLHKLVCLPFNSINNALLSALFPSPQQFEERLPIFCTVLGRANRSAFTSFILSKTAFGTAPWKILKGADPSLSNQYAVWFVDKKQRLEVIEKMISSKEKLPSMEDDVNRRCETLEFCTNVKECGALELILKNRFMSVPQVLTVEQIIKLFKGYLGYIRLLSQTEEGRRELIPRLQNIIGGWNEQQQKAMGSYGAGQNGAQIQKLVQFSSEVSSAFAEIGIELNRMDMLELVSGCIFQGNEALQLKFTASLFKCLERYYVAGNEKIIDETFRSFAKLYELQKKVFPELRKAGDPLTLKSIDSALRQILELCLEEPTDPKIVIYFDSMAKDWLLEDVFVSYSVDLTTEMLSFFEEMRDIDYKKISFEDLESFCTKCVVYMGLIPHYSSKNDGIKATVKLLKEGIAPFVANYKTKKQQRLIKCADWATKIADASKEYLFINAHAQHLDKATLIEYLECQKSAILTNLHVKKDKVAFRYLRNYHEIIVKSYKGDALIQMMAIYVQVVGFNLILRSQLVGKLFDENLKELVAFFREVMEMAVTQEASCETTFNLVQFMFAMIFIPPFALKVIERDASKGKIKEKDHSKYSKPLLAPFYSEDTPEYHLIDQTITTNFVQLGLEMAGDNSERASAQLQEKRISDLFSDVFKVCITSKFIGEGTSQKTAKDLVEYLKKLIHLCNPNLEQILAKLCKLLKESQEEKL